MSKTRGRITGRALLGPPINQDTPFELKGQFLKELCNNTFSGSEHEDANEHIEKVLEIVDLFHIRKVTQDQFMLRAFPVSLTKAASRWLRNQPSGSITTWEDTRIVLRNNTAYPRAWDTTSLLENYDGISLKRTCVELSRHAEALVITLLVRYFLEKNYHEQKSGVFQF
ncbi:hypothetical protein Tco_0031162 [Tanacetum coccineum]